MGMNWGSQFEDPLRSLESALRSLIHDMLCNEYGSSWYRNERVGLGEDWADNLHAKMVSEHGERTASHYDIPLVYAEFSDLADLLERNSSKFGQVFRDCELTIALLRKAIPLRNAVRHSRDITPGQFALLVGISSEIEDEITMWFTASSGTHTSMELQFTKLVTTGGKADAEILGECSELVSDLAKRVSQGIVSTGYPQEHVRKSEISPYHIVIKAGHDETTIRTGDDAAPKYRSHGIDYKGIHVAHLRKASSRMDPAAVCGAVGSPYLGLTYTMSERFDVPKLEELCRGRAGLRISSAGSVNGIRTGIEYGFLSNAIRIGVSNSSDGRGILRVSSEEGFHAAHDILPPKRLLEFLVGGIPPRAMVHLLSLSREPPRGSFGTSMGLQT